MFFQKKKNQRIIITEISLFSGFESNVVLLKPSDLLESFVYI